MTFREPKVDLSECFAKVTSRIAMEKNTLEPTGF